MSDTIEKYKNSKRRHNDEVKSKKQYDLAKLSNFPHIDKKSPHIYHKMHAYNCGDPKCYMCGNPRKFFKEKTIQEKKFEQDDYGHQERNRRYSGSIDSGEEGES